MPSDAAGIGHVLRGGDLVRTMVTTALDVLGACLVVAGVALVSIPAAFVVAGAGVLAASWRASR